MRKININIKRAKTNKTKLKKVNTERFRLSILDHLKIYLLKLLMIKIKNISFCIILKEEKLNKKKTDLSLLVAKLAKKALEKAKITKVYFDRGRYKVSWTE